MAEYLVRGALLACQKGSHPRRLNLPMCHGVYTSEHPIIRESDCKLDDNINHFGVCKSGTPPENAKTVAFAPYNEKESSKNQVEGPKCCPDIIGKWRNVHETSKISGEESAITTDSFLVCRCGGLIEPHTSGQEYEEEDNQ
jgi:hypothetical protein